MKQEQLTMSAVNGSILDDLRGQIVGKVISPAEADYDEARAVWNGMINHFPALIVQCANVADVQAALRFAQMNGIRVSVRGGGHHVAGAAVRDHALVIDLRMMRQVEVDPIRRVVTAEGGATWGDVDNMTQRFGLAVPGGVVSETGIAGLTLGGGFGWLRNKYGLSCDNLIAAEVVTASGELLTVNEQNHPELLWGLRGGGGQFGVVTQFHYQAHPVGPEVMFAFVMHPGSQAHAGLQFYRDFIAEAPPEVSALAVLGNVPHDAMYPAAEQGKPYVLFGACYAGDPAVGERILQPLRDFAQPIADFSTIMPYVEMQTMYDADYPAGEKRYYWKSSYLNALSDEAIDVLVKMARNSPPGEPTIDIWHTGQAVQAVAPDATAFANRHVPYIIGIEANWHDSTDDVANLNWVQQVIAALKPFSNQQQYLNFPGFMEEDNFLETVFGQNAARLAALKERYDPMNVFRLRG